MVILFEVDPSGRWKPKIERAGIMTRIIFGFFSIAIFRKTGIHGIGSFIHEINCQKIREARESAKAWNTY